MTKRAGGLIRISDPRLGIDADSPGLQRDSIKFHAKKLGYIIDDDDFLEIWESASGNSQPSDQAVKFCQDHNLDTLIIMNIARYTRGGLDWYFPLKRGLQAIGVQLLDTEGIISAEKVNTLEEYGVNYNWSVYDKSEEEEAKEALDARKDLRKRLTSMIKAELRYASLGYWMYGSAPYGYKVERVDTENGLRWLLIPHPEESVYIKKIYELKTLGKTPDEIVEEVNGLGYRSRITKKRHPQKNMKDVIIGQRGGVKLTAKRMAEYLKNPIYAGVLWEYRMVDGKPVKQKPKKMAGTPLITHKLWNQANDGKWNIATDNDGVIYVTRGATPSYLLFKNVHNDLFPYKQHVACPKCRKPLYGSTSRNGSGQPNSRYHCSRSGHYWSVGLAEFNTTIESFVKNIKLKDEVILSLKVKLMGTLESNRDGILNNTKLIDDKIASITAEQQALIQQAKKVSLPMIIKSIEDDIGKLELELGLLQTARNKQENQKAKLQEAINYYWDFLEHPQEYILQPDKPIQSAKFFSLLFEEVPTYEEIKLGTASLACVYELNDNPNIVSEPRGIRTHDQELKRLLLYH